MFRLGKRSGSASAYARVGVADSDRWMRESLVQQMFHDHLARGEVNVAVAEVALVYPASEGRSIHAWAAVTDCALHARLTLGAGVHQTLRVGYGQVQHVEVSGADEMSLQVALWNPERAVNEVWHLHLTPSLASAGFAASLAHAVSKHRAQAGVAAAGEPATAAAAARASEASVA